MIRQMIIPTQNTYLLHLPDEMIGKNVEVIAFSQEDISSPILTEDKTEKRTVKEAIAFYRKNSVDFGKLEKWNREDLYEQNFY